MVMHHSDLGTIQNIPVMLMHTKTPINVFEIHKESRIHYADLLHGGSANEQAGTQNPINVSYTKMIIILHEMVGIDFCSGEDVSQWCTANEYMAYCIKSSARVLQCPVRMNQLR